MNYRILVVMASILAAAISGCSGTTPTPTIVYATPTVAPAPGSASHGNPIGGHVEFVDTLRALGATVEPVGPVTQPFFTPEGYILKVNGADVQIKPPKVAAGASISVDNRVGVNSGYSAKTGGKLSGLTIK